MPTRLFALITGLIYTIWGLMGFFAPFSWRPEMERLRNEFISFHSHYFLGFIEANWPHDILWLVMGLAGLAAFISFNTSALYARGLFVVTVLLTLTGLMPLGIGSLWGFLPLFGWNVILHAVTAICAWYYGLVYPYEQRMPVRSPIHLPI
ncbi:MAG TPA: DUF4383 domain-containing protein [Tepidisphaeraceae bacterium]|jgi:hypothetical protein|nr:DUF4383 domain-containing protein [Tepidisphaeraceae bacterium]